LVLSGGSFQLRLVAAELQVFPSLCVSIAFFAFSLSVSEPPDLAYTLELLMMLSVP
jgi:hypothetical protein